MRRFSAIALAAALAIASTAALARCPPHAPYGCVSLPNGKILCGCGR